MFLQLATEAFAVTKVADVVLDARGMTLTEGAMFGRAINGQAFQGDGITSFNGYQYATHFVTDRPAAEPEPRFYLAVARRKVDGGAWEVVNLPDSPFKNGTGRKPKPWDCHNTPSIGVCAGDGSIHLAYDHHDNLLRYRATAPGVATDPTNASWDASLFKAETAELLAGEPVTTVTYPAFVRTPTGGLQLAMRRGFSGNGSWWLYDYSAERHAWVGGRQYDDGTVGQYAAVDPPSPTRCAYPNDWTYGPDGRLHVTFAWREGKANGSNHDLNYAYSDDGGASWKSNAGQLIADTRVDESSAVPKRITIDSPGLVVQPLPITSSLMNTQGQAVDGAGRIHALMWHRDSAKPQAADAVWDAVGSSYFHYWRDQSGTWKRGAIPSESGAPIGCRPRLVFDKDDNAVAVYTLRSGHSAGTTDIYFNEGDLVIATASAKSKWTDWKVVHVETGPFVNEPPVDRPGLSERGVLTVMMQRSPAADLEATPIRTMDYKVGAQ